MKKSLVIMAVLAIAATCAQAGMLAVPLTSQAGGTATMKIYYDGTQSVVTTGTGGATRVYDKFHVTVTAATADNINAVDIKVTPVGTSGANWLLSIRPFDWASGPGATGYGTNPVDLTGQGTSYSGAWLHNPVIDTHFNVTDWGAGETAAVEPTVLTTNLGVLSFDDSAVLSPFYDEEDPPNQLYWGTTYEKPVKSQLLQAVSAVDVPSGVTWTVMNIVCMKDKQVTLASKSAAKWFGTGGVGHAFAPASGASSITFDNTIPEPATLVLIGLGGLGLLSRRRR